MEGFILMIIRPKSADKAETKPAAGNPGKLPGTLGFAVAAIIGIVLVVNYLRPAEEKVDIAQDKPEVKAPSFVSTKVKMADVKPAAPVASPRERMTNEPYGGEHLKNNLHEYRAKQADDLRKQLNDGQINGHVDSLTLSAERIKALENSGNVVW
jgi:hypothetical protein